MSCPYTLSMCSSAVPYRTADQICPRKNKKGRSSIPSEMPHTAMFTTCLIRTPAEKTRVSYC